MTAGPGVKTQTSEAGSNITTGDGYSECMFEGRAGRGGGRGRKNNDPCLVA